MTAPAKLWLSFQFGNIRQRRISAKADQPSAGAKLSGGKSKAKKSEIAKEVGNL